MSGGTGLIVRDHEGVMLRAHALWFDHATNALCMEARAICEGARLALERGFLRVIIESDSKVAVDLCNDKSSNTSEIMSICNEIREIKRALSSCSIRFVGRDANSVAHLCAKQASSDRRRCLWINYNPGFLDKTLRSDCNPDT